MIEYTVTAIRDYWGHQEYCVASYGTHTGYRVRDERVTRFDTGREVSDQERTMALRLVQDYQRQRQA